MSIRRSKGILALAVAGILAVSACTESAPPQPNIQVEEAWVRAVDGLNVNTAAYMTLRNTGKAPDRLIGVRAEIARMTGIHRTTIDERGLARMTEVEALDLPARGAAVLEPGGFHIMLVGVGSLVEGDTVEITLLLEGSGSLDIAAEVRAF
jgi:copper(I)-binding protein